MKLGQVSAIHETEAALLRRVGNLYSDADRLTFLGMENDLWERRGSASAEQPEDQEREWGSGRVGE